MQCAIIAVLVGIVCFVLGIRTSVEMAVRVIAS